VDDQLDQDHSRVLNHALAPPAGSFQIDPVHTFVGFSAQHLVVGRVRGRFNDVGGTVVVAEDLSASTLEATVDMASIDTKNPTWTRICAPRTTSTSSNSP
jgi:polyisoprenoid-binding protein YceI